MKILVVSSTLKEVEPFLDFLENPQQINENFFKKDFLNNEIFVFISGVGCYSMIYGLSKILFNYNFDLVINIGIAGAYNRNFHIGEVVFVLCEQIGDLGIDQDGVFVSLFQTDLVSANSKPFENGVLVNPNKFLYEIMPNIRRVNGLTVNTVTGQQNNSSRLAASFNVDIETMEGAGFFYVCLMENAKFVELRAISNYVGSRKENQWYIFDATQSVNRELRLFVLEYLRRV